MNYFIIIVIIVMIYSLIKGFLEAKEYDKNMYDFPYRKIFFKTITYAIILIIYYVIEYCG